VPRSFCATRCDVSVLLLRYVLRFHLYLFVCTAPAVAVLYTLSLHDALPICWEDVLRAADHGRGVLLVGAHLGNWEILPLWISLQDRKSTRLNSSHVSISYAVFCLKKKIRSKATTEKKHVSWTLINHQWGES